MRYKAALVGVLILSTVLIGTQALACDPNAGPPTFGAQIEAVEKCVGDAYYSLLTTGGLFHFIRSADEIGFTPRVLEALEGDRIKWAASSGNHNFYSYGGGQTIARQAPHQQWEYTEFGGGTIWYRCTIHSGFTAINGECRGMCGAITDSTSAPSAPFITSPLNGASVDVNAVPFSGTGDPFSKVDLYQGTTKVASAIVGQDGNWFAAVPTVLGENTILARAKDPLDRVSPDSASVTLNQTKSTVDSQWPVSQIYGAEIQKFIGVPVSLSGIALDNILVSRIILEFTNELGQTTSFQLPCSGCPKASAKWNVSLSIPPGRYLVRAVAWDISNNPSSPSLGSRGALNEVTTVEVNCVAAHNTLPCVELL